MAISIKYIDNINVFRNNHPGVFYKTLGTYSFSLETAIFFVSLGRVVLSKMVTLSKKIQYKGAKKWKNKKN